MNIQLPCGEYSGESWLTDNEYSGKSRLPGSEYTGESQLPGREYTGEIRLPSSEYTGESPWKSSNSSINVLNQNCFLGCIMELGGAVWRKNQTQ